MEPCTSNLSLTDCVKIDLKNRGRTTASIVNVTLRANDTTEIVDKSVVHRIVNTIFAC